MHIAFVNLIIEYYSPISGGALSTCIMQQAKGLSQKGHQVSILSPSDAHPTYDVGEFHPLQTRQRHQLSLPVRVISKLRSKLLKWDWPYYDFYRNSTLQALARLSPAPDAIICVNDYRTTQHVSRAMPNSVVMMTLANEVPSAQHDLSAQMRGVHRILAVSDYIRQWAINKHTFPPSQVTTLRNGADTSSFHPRSNFLEPSTPLKVLFLGRITEEKGPDLAVEAVHDCQREGLDVQLTVAGAKWWHNNGELDDFSKQLALRIEACQGKHLGLVTRERIPDLIRQQDVVLMPSRWNEPCGLVQFEAMASGCAVIASNRGGIPEGTGDAAILCDPDDAGSFGRALLSLAASPEKLIKRKKASLAHSKTVSWDANVDQLEQIIGDLVMQRRSLRNSSLQSALA